MVAPHDEHPPVRSACWEAGGRDGEATPIDRALPRPVALEVDGHPPTLIAEYTLDDLASLQAWLRGLDDPLDALGDEPDRAAVLAAWDALEHWPPTPFDPIGRAILATPGGRLVQLVTSMCRAGAEGAGKVGAALAPHMTAKHWRKLDRVAWGLAPWKQLARMLTAEPLSDGSGQPYDPDDVGDGRPFDPGAAVASLVDRYEWTWAEAGAVTLTQWNLLRRRFPPENDRDPGRIGAPDRYYGLARLAGESKADWLARDGAMLRGDQ